jgi:hypothetical protein
VVRAEGTTGSHRRAWAMYWVVGMFFAGFEEEEEERKKLAGFETLKKLYEL